MKKVIEILKEKYIFIIIFIFLIICTIIIFSIIPQNQNIKDLNKKLSLIEKNYFKSEEIKNLKDDKESIIAISIGNNESQAIVSAKYGGAFNNVYKKVKNDIQKIIEKNNYAVKNVKVDFAEKMQTLSFEEFENVIESYSKNYTFRNGIILDYEEKEDVILLEAELNSNSIIDYDFDTIDLDNLNAYLVTQEKETVSSLPNNIKIFTTVSYFCDDSNKTYELCNDGWETGRRKIDKLEGEQIEEILNTSYDYLINMLQDDGKFIYGYSAIENAELEDYNIVRHSGTIWALSAKCEASEENKNKISSAINYLGDYTINYNDQIAFIISNSNKKTSLGANGLTLVAICEYINKFQDMKYIDMAKKLGNGIIAMQQEDGKLIHEINVENLETSREFITEFYDNEATLALCKLYGITKEEKYLQSAEKSIQYFINNDYIKYKSHWFSYALNEVTKYVDKEEYYVAGLQNISNSLNSIKNKENTSHTNFEMLMQGFELYDRIMQKKLKIEELNNFPVEEFLETIQNRAKYQLNSYLYPEVAMYLKEPAKYQKTFYIRADAFRIRIDDIQHSMMGYLKYLENKDKIEEYIKNTPDYLNEIQ